MKRYLVLTSLLIIFQSTLASADDSSAALAAGGLVLTKSAQIRMAREDLSISPKAVYVRYEFVNDGPKDVETLVAFPLPDIDLYQYSGEAIGTVKNVTPNFVGFELKVDGKKIEATAEEKAIHEGRDVTQQIRAAGLPINMAGTNLYDVLPKLSLETRRALVKAGLMEIDGPKGEDPAGDDFHPKWIAATKFFWRQRFPVEKTVVIEHSYEPVTGQAFFSNDELAGSDPYYLKTYCIDAGTKKVIAGDLARLAHMKREEGDILNAYSTDFVLSTAANWKGPIGLFHLTLDKLKPENVLSLCWDGLKKTGSTTFGFAAANFAPKRDVQMLVLSEN